MTAAGGAAEELKTITERVVVEGARGNRELSELAGLDHEGLLVIFELARAIARAPTEEPLITDRHLLDSTELLLVRTLLIGLAIGRELEDSASPPASVPDA